MKSLRKLIGLVLALAITAVAMPASAGPKAFQILTPTAPNATFGTAQPIVVYFKNVGTSSSFNSIELEAQTVNGATLDITNAVGSPGKRGSFQKLSPTRFLLTNLSPTGTGQQLTVTLTATLTATSCSAATIAWRGGAWTGSPSLPSSEFDPTGTFGTTSTATGSTSCSVRFVPTFEPKSTTLASPATSVAVTSILNEPTGAGVQAEVMIGANRDTNFNGSVTIVKTSGPLGSVIGNATVAATSGLATFGNSTTATPLTLNMTGSYTLKATGGAWESAPVTLLVSNKVLDCWDGTGVEPAAGTFFNASVGASDVPEPGWAAGYRGEDTKGLCTKTNYLATNNINGPPGTTDANGFVLPSNAFSIVYEIPPGNDVVLGYTLTFKPELAGTNGLPDPNKTAKYCKNVDGSKNCVPSTTSTPNPNLFDLLGCVSPSVAVTSLPLLGSVREAACLAGFAWSTVDPAECGETNTAACVTVTIRVIDGRDPPIIR